MHGQRAFNVRALTIALQALPPSVIENTDYYMMAYTTYYDFYTHARALTFSVELFCAHSWTSALSHYGSVLVVDLKHVAQIMAGVC